MTDADPVLAEAANLVVVEMDAMRQPDALVQPADFLEIVERAATEMGKAELVLVPRLAEMGMQPAVIFLGQGRAVDHQLPGDVERRAGRDRHAAERALRGVVIFRQHALAVGDHGVVVLHQPFVGDAAALRAEIDGAARQRDAHAEPLGFLGLDVDGIRHVGAEDEQMVRGGGAARHQQFGEREADAQPEAVAVQMRAPARIERLQPGKQFLVDRVGMRAGQRLEEMVMRVDEAGQHDVAAGVDDLVAGRGRAFAADQLHDFAAGNHQAAFSALGKDGDRVAQPDALW